MMRDLPFTVSPSAAAFIAEAMQVAEAEPSFAGLVPTLTYACNSVTFTPGGRIIDRRQAGYYQFGWHDPHQVSDWDRFRVAGFELAVPPEVQDMLRGHNLELEVTEGKERESRYLVGRKY